MNLIFFVYYDIIYNVLISCQNGNFRTEVPFNSSYWAPFDAHDPTLVQEILLGLSRTPAEKADLAMAENTKICKLQFFKHRVTFHIYGRLIISDLLF